MNGPYSVQARGTRLRSMFCVYGKEWEPAGLFDTSTFDDLETAMMFLDDCVESEDGMDVHAFRVVDASGAEIAKWRMSSSNNKRNGEVQDVHADALVALATLFA